MTTWENINFFLINAVNVGISNFTRLYQEIAVFSEYSHVLAFNLHEHYTAITEYYTASKRERGQDYSSIVARVLEFKNFLIPCF